MEDLWTILIIIGIVTFKLIKSASGKRPTDDNGEPVVIINHPIEENIQTIKPHTKRREPNVETAEEDKRQHTETLREEEHNVTAEDIRKAVIWSEILNRKY